jgi:short subunit dehydrogenase-like uncharacterized protein
MATARTRDRSRRFDIVLWGATGFTGRLTAEYLARTHAGEGLRIALGGRNRQRLDEVRSALVALDPSAQLEVLVGDSHDPASLEAIARDAEVVCSTVGPYAKYGGPLVAACVEAGTDYCDLTGEPQFVRAMIDQHHERAQQTGARIVHCCGFDSIPSDLGTWMLVREAKAQFDLRLDEVKLITGRVRGGVSGGTIASMMQVIEDVKADRSILRKIGNPYGLNPEGERRGPDRGDQKGVRYDADLPGWTGPFVMASINTRVVRRTNALLDYAYGRDFRYSECSGTGEGPAGLLRATALAGGVAGMMAGAAFEPTRKLLMRKLPAPGQGPSAAKREAGSFELHLIGKATGGAKTVRGRVVGTSDPGYGETAKMLGESALCLALDGGALEAPGGIGTPAFVMGQHLLNRLRTRGMTFEMRS